MLVEHCNSESESINIRECMKEPFVGQYVLSVVDDGPSYTEAAMLLDEGTIDWLMEKLTLIKNKKVLA